MGRLILFGSLSVAGIFVLGTEGVLIAYAVVGMTVVAYTPVSLFWMRRRPASDLPVWTILLLDCLLMGVIIHLAGGVDGPLAVVMMLLPLTGGLLLGQRGGLGVAFAATAALLSSAYLEVVGIQVQFGSPLIAALRTEGELMLTIRYVGLRTFVLACLLVAAGVVSGYLSETLRRESGRVQNVLKALRETEARADEILGSMSDGVIVVDSAGNPLRANRSALELLGLGDRWRSDLPTSPVYSLLTDYLDTGSFPEALDVFVRDRILECRISGFRKGGDEPSGAIAVVSDVTELRHLRADLEEKEKMAVLGRLSATMAHEIRNPLASISGSVQLLRSKTLPPDGEERLMNLVVRESVRISDVLESYLELARPARAGEFESIELASLLEEVVELARRGSNGVGVEFEVNAGDEPVIEGSRARLSQLFGNIVRNAIQATEGVRRGRVVVNVSSCKDSDVGSAATVEVRDNGCGVGPDILMRMTDPFVTTKDSGTGLGLFVARKVAEDHGGSISFESEEGSGTIVLVTLPVSQPESDAREAEEGRQ